MSYTLSEHDIKALSKAGRMVSTVIEATEDSKKLPAATKAIAECNMAGENACSSPCDLDAVALHHALVAHSTVSVSVELERNFDYLGDLQLFYEEYVTCDTRQQACDDFLADLYAEKDVDTLDTDVETIYKAFQILYYSPVARELYKAFKHRRSAGNWAETYRGFSHADFMLKLAEGLTAHPLSREQTQLLVGLAPDWSPDEMCLRDRDYTNNVYDAAEEVTSCGLNELLDAVMLLSIDS